MSYNSEDTNVRVLSSSTKRIMYLSRAKVPYNYKNDRFCSKACFSYYFTYSGLMKYKKLKQSPLEKIEDIELLRAIENDMKVYSCEMKESSFSVDVNDDYLKAKIAMSQDSFRGFINNSMLSVLDANYNGKKYSIYISDNSLSNLNIF